MIIGILSDTHDDVEGVQQALHALKKWKASLLIHCGDIGPEVIPYLKELPTHFVIGNTDDAEQLRSRTWGSAHTYHEKFGHLEIEGICIAFMHGHDVKLLHHTIHSGHWDLVCHGHTHVFSSKKEGRTLALNPGAISRTDCPSLAVVETPSLKVTRIALD